MDRIRRKPFACLGAASLALILTACPRELPEVRILETRAAYSLEPSGFLIEEPETADTASADAEATAAAIADEAVAVAAEAVAVAAASAEEAVEGETLDEETTEPPGPRSVAVLFDLLIRFEGTGEALPGITVEVLQSDRFETEKARHLTWVDTGGLSKGEERQVPVRLEVEDYEDGDAFSIEWNAFVPPEKRGEYREFAEAAP